MLIFRFCPLFQVCAFSIRQPSSSKSSLTTASRSMQSSHTGGRAMRCRSRICRAIAQQRRLATLNWECAAAKLQKANSITFGWIPAVSIRPVVLNCQSLSIQCTGGIKTQRYAMHSFSTYRVYRCQMIRALPTVRDLLEVGLCKNSLHLLLSNSPTPTGKN